MLHKAISFILILVLLLAGDMKKPTAAAPRGSVTFNKANKTVKGKAKPIVTPQASPGGFAYPKAKQGMQVDDYHGTKVADPYRWLEDPDAKDTQAWIAAENKITFDFLGKIPAREQIKARLTKLWNYERYGVPFKDGGRYFYYKNDGLQNQNVLYTMRKLDEPPRVLLDPNSFSADGTVALMGTSVSEDGKYIAYGISVSGSDWMEWKLRDIESGKDLDDDLKWIKFSGASWTRDSKGFFYSRYDEPAGQGNKLKDVNYYQKLYYHRVGTPQAQDELIYERKDQKEWGFSGDVTEDGRYLIITVWQGTERKNRLFYRDLQDKKGKVVELLNDFDAQYSFAGNDGPLFWFLTNLNAPRSRVIAIDTRKPDRAFWSEIVPQTKETLDNVSLLNDTLVATYMKDAHSLIRVYDLKGKYLRDVELPGIGSAGGFYGKRRDTETFYSYTSFTVPNTIYHYDLKTGKSTLYRKPKVDFDPDGFVTEQVFYASKDGTKVPMFITYKKGMKLDGTNPTYLYGYGGFNIALTPAFSVSNLVWMERGGVFAEANLRGGGEYGESWHEAGTKERKQNVFDDFIAAAEWLIANKYTSTPKLAISGGSNGGLLVGACLTQRPDLFGAAEAHVGVMDMLRFQQFTIGWAWISDYGTSDKPEDFKYLYKYSPLHNIKPGTHYPATLLFTGDHDDRVYPAHTFKFAAALQAAQAGPAPVLIRIETKAGHGAGKPTTKLIDEISDSWAFLTRVLGM